MESARLEPEALRLLVGRRRLLHYRPGMWRGQHPGAADISLVVQISDSSLSFDLGEKLALYRANGIQEYWVVDLKATQVTSFCGAAFQEPNVQGSH